MLGILGFSHHGDQMFTEAGQDPSLSFPSARSRVGVLGSDVSSDAVDVFHRVRQWLALIDYFCSQFPVMISVRSALRKDDNSGLVDNSRSCSDSKIHSGDNLAEQKHSYLELEPSAPLLVAGSSVRSMGSCFFMGGGGGTHARNFWPIRS